MRTGIVLALGMLSGCMGTPPTGFGDIAARGEMLEIAVPLWMDGALKVGADGVGTVRRRAVGREEGPTLFGVADRTIDRYGRVTFDVAGQAVGGQLSGDCTYDRRERRLEAGSLEIADAVEPLSLRCTFARDGAGVGSLTLYGIRQARGVTFVTRRVGEVRMGDAALDLRSMHRVGGGKGVPTDTPVGYEFVTPAGRTVGAVNVNGARRRQLVLPVAGADRDAALAAGIALAVFWDPGDTDD